MKNLLFLSLSCFAFLSASIEAQRVYGPHPSRLVEDYTGQDLAQRAWWLAEDAWLALDPSFYPTDEEGELLDSGVAISDLRFMLSGAAYNGSKVSSFFSSESPNIDAAMELIKDAPVFLSYSLRNLSDGSVLQQGSQQVTPGNLICLSEINEHPVVGSFDVEIAQGVSIADPTIQSAFDGLSLAMMLHPVASSGWQAEVVFVQTTSGKSMSIEAHSTDIKGLERLPRGVAEFSNSTKLIPGSSSSMFIQGVGGVPLQLDLQVTGTPSPVATTLDSLEVTVVDARCLTENQLRDLAKHLSEYEAKFSQHGWVILSGDGQQSGSQLAADFIDQLTASKQCTLTVSVANDEAEEVIYQMTGNLVQGRTLRLAQGSSFQAITDWDVEIACSSRIADPLMSQCFSGIHGSIAWLGGSDIQLDLDLSKCGLGATKQLTLGSALVASEDHLGEVLLPEQNIQVESVNELTLGTHGKFRLDAEAKVQITKYVQHMYEDKHQLTISLEVK